MARFRYQLTREHRKDSSNDTLYYNNFFYDDAGNRTRLEYNDGASTITTTYLYNTADQLTRETVGVDDHVARVEDSAAYFYYDDALETVAGRGATRIGCASLHDS